MLNAILDKTLRPKIDQWIDKRIPSQSGHYFLDRRSIYIIPSRFGAMFGLILIAMLVGSINYEINLGFILTFLFAAIVFIGMLQTYKNLSVLQFSLLPIEATFAGQAISLKMKSLNKANLKNIAITIDESIQNIDLPAQSLQSLQLTQQHRGEHTIKKIKLATIYPLGLFYCWSWLKPDCRYIVYPEPKVLTNKIQPPVSQNISGEHSSSHKGEDELYAYRPYNEGDPINRVAWKKTAQTGKLHSQELSKLVTQDYYIQWDDFHFADVETRLSYMCQQVLDAHKNNTAYGLILPNEKISPDHSEQHKHICLTALALFNQHG